MKINTLRWLCKWKKICMILFLGLVTGAGFAQVQISGKVTDRDQNGVAGVSVLVKNTTAGTATDANGNYTFSPSIQQGRAVLQFYGVGFKTHEESINFGSSN